MTLEEVKDFIEQRKAAGDTEEDIVKVFYMMYSDNKMTLKDLETLLDVMGWEFTDEFKAMTESDKKRFGLTKVEGVDDHKKAIRAYMEKLNKDVEEWIQSDEHRMTFFKENPEKVSAYKLKEMDCGYGLNLPESYECPHVCKVCIDCKYRFEESDEYHWGYQEPTCKKYTGTTGSGLKPYPIMFDEEDCGNYCSENN